MNWTKLLTADAEASFNATLGLVDLVDDDMLAFKPETGSNWMTMGQLLMHLTTACGFCCRGFLTGDWGMPEGQKVEDLPPDEMLPPAEKMPTVETVAQAREMIEKDKALTFEMIAEAGEEGLASKMVNAPWNPEPRNLGHHFIHMISHLDSHKSQLFYYLKLLGKPVHTGSLWGM